MSTIKNWEAQARTNSILASSLKTLEHRVQELSILLQWKSEAEGKFDDISEAMALMNDQFEDFEQQVEDNQINLKMQIDKLGEQNKSASRFFPTKFSFRQNKGQSKIDTVDEGSIMPPSHFAALDTSEKNAVRYQRAVHFLKNNWLAVVACVLLAVQLVAAALYFADMVTTESAAAKLLAASLGLALIASAGSGVYAQGLTPAKQDYSVRKGTLFGFLSIQTWIIAAGALHLQSSAREAAKREQYCLVDEWVAFASDRDPKACDNVWPPVKVTTGIASVVASLLLSWIFMVLYSKAEEDRVSRVIPTILKSILKKSRLLSQKAPHASISVKATHSGQLPSMPATRANSSVPQVQLGKEESMELQLPNVMTP